MSAQRRTASKRDATATATPPRGGAPGAARSASAPAPVAAPAPTPAPPRTGSARPPKPAAADRGRTAEPERSGLNQRAEGVRRLYRDTLAEMKKINWPDRETTKNLTIVVIGISVVLGVLLGGIDFLLQALFEAV